MFRGWKLDRRSISPSRGGGCGHRHCGSELEVGTRYGGLASCSLPELIGIAYLSRGGKVVVWFWYEEIDYRRRKR